MQFLTRSWFRLALLTGCVALLLSEWLSDLDMDAKVVRFKAQGHNIPAMVAVQFTGALGLSGAEALRWSDIGCVTAGWFAFGTCLLICMRPSAPPRGTRLAGLLGLQALLGVALNSDLLYLVAAQLGFLLSFGAAATAWAGLAGVLATSMLPALLLRSTAGITCNIADLPHPPRQLDLWLAFMGDAALQFFALCVGYLAASELRDRTALAQAQVSLKASEAVLEDIVRQAEQDDMVRRMREVLDSKLSQLVDAVDRAAAGAEGVALNAVTTAKQLADELTAERSLMADAISTAPTFELALALHRLCAAVPQPAIELIVAANLPPLSPAHANALLRTVQEAVTNAIRHAQADRMWIALAVKSAALHLTLHDNGRGMGNAKPGNGLRGLRERIEAAGGRLSFADQSTGGLALQVELPVVQRTGNAS